MLVKLLSLVVEGTTSLSNIFKSRQSNQPEVEKRSISIRNLQPIEEISETETLSMESVLQERDRLFAIERRAIEEERRQIDDMRRVAAEDIGAMQTAWTEEKQRLQQEAYEEAFQIGFSEGREKALGEMKESIEQATEITKQSAQNAEQYQTSQERVILEIAMMASERIIGTVLNDDEEKFLDVVRKALKEVREMKEIKMYVSLDYYPLVSDNRSELASIFPPEVPFLIFPNEDFESTECYIETNHGRIVVSIDEQLKHLREQLIEVLESRD